MTTPSITIEFGGLCTHYRDIVAGVPHRVVLTDATAVRTGTMVTPSVPDGLSYSLPPHFAIVHAVLGEQIIGVTAPTDNVLPDLWINDGVVLAGVRLQILNAIDPFLEYPGQLFAQYIPRVADYAFNYRYSDNVVLGGRAMCYFDLFRGSVAVTIFGAAFHAVVTMQTEGDPILQVTALAPYNRMPTQPDEKRPATNVTLPAGCRLFVANRGTSCADARFDFLWHLTTDQASVPRYLPRDPHGFEGLTPCDPGTLEEQFHENLTHGWLGGNIDPAHVRDNDPVGTAESCSNSQFP